MKYHTLFFHKLGKMLQNLSSAAVVIGALMGKIAEFPELAVALKNFRWSRKSRYYRNFAIFTRHIGLRVDLEQPGKLIAETALA